jgi:hypothetical protein
VGNNIHTEICVFTIDWGSAMKTTLDLNDALMTQAKAAAAQQRLSLTRLIEESLRLRLSMRRPAGAAVVVPVYAGVGGLVLGVDGLSNKAMLDAADS